MAGYLFGYTGGATVACASAGASVVHIDSSKGMVERAKENLELSGLKDKPIPDSVAAFGEIGLSGEVRSVTNVIARINEIKKLGFKTCILPKQNLKNLRGMDLPEDIELIGVSNIKEAFSVVG